MILTLDTPVAHPLVCPLCRHPLAELGFLYSGRRFVPRPIAMLKGFRIDGVLEGFQYGCWECGAVLLVGSSGPMD